MYQGSCKKIVTTRMDTCAHVVVPKLHLVTRVVRHSWPAKPFPMRRVSCRHGKSCASYWRNVGVSELRLLKEISFVNESWCQNHL